MSSAFDAVTSLNTSRVGRSPTDPLSNAPPWNVQASVWRRVQSRMHSNSATNHAFHLPRQ